MFAPMKGLPRAQIQEAGGELPTEMVLLSGISPPATSAAPKTVAPAEAVVAAQVAPPTSFSGCVGRLIRGKSAADFESLTNDSTRKLVFLMDSQGLEELEGKSGYQQLIQIGHTPEHILEETQNKGNKYKLVIWPKGVGPDAPATWDNVANMMKDVYPDIADKVAARLPELKAVDFSHWEDQAGYRFADVKPGDPRFIGYEELKNGEGTAHEVRSFLYNVCHLRELYTGDGFTKKADGTRGVPEYISPNLKVADLPGARVIDVKVDLPPYLPMM